MDKWRAAISTLSQRDELFAALLESSDDIILIIDPDNFAVVSFNSRLEKVCRQYFSIDIHAGMSSRDIPIFAYDKWDEVFRKVTQQGSYSFEETLFDENTPFLITCNSIYIGDEITWLIAYCKDISEIKAYQNGLENSYTILKNVFSQTILAMSKFVEIKDPYTVGHQNRVAKLAVAIAEFLHMSPDRVECVLLASNIHDIGKISIPSEILSKPGPMSQIEFDILKTHVQSGYDILRTIDFPWPIAGVVYQHHERMDGSGYPNGLCGSEILMESRILAVADVVEAVSSDRPYREARGIDAAIMEIFVGRDKLFDPDVVDACVKLFAEHQFTFDD